MTGDQATLGADLRLGRWQDVLADVECDALIFDAPYGRRVHEKHNAMRRSDASDARGIDYASIGGDDIAEIVSSWSGRTRGWLVTITSHDLIPVWEAELEAAGRYVFAPIPVIDRGSRVRLQGDGPSSWSVFMVCSRPRSAEMAKWGTLPGDYLYDGHTLPAVYERSKGDDRSKRMGGKPLGVMQAIVRDYSRAGDLVCDPFAGHATTLLAALTEGRRAVGSEVDPDAYAAAQARLDRGYTPSLMDHARAPAAEQVGLPMVVGE